MIIFFRIVKINLKYFINVEIFGCKCYAIQICINKDIPRTTDEYRKTKY